MRGFGTSPGRTGSWMHLGIYGHPTETCNSNRNKGSPSSLGGKARNATPLSLVPSVCWLKLDSGRSPQISHLADQPFRFISLLLAFSTRLYMAVVCGDFDCRAVLV